MELIDKHSEQISFRIMTVDITSQSNVQANVSEESAGATILTVEVRQTKASLELQ